MYPDKLNVDKCIKYKFPTKKFKISKDRAALYALSIGLNRKDSANQ